MAGNYKNAFATVTPNQQNIGDAINDVENLGFRYRTEQRLIDAEEQKKKDDRERKLKDFNDNSPKFVPTGVETEDEYMYAGVQNAANQLYEVQKQFNELNNKTNLTPEEERKLYQLSAKRNNLQNYPENLKRMMESQTNAAKDYLEGIKTGKYLQDPNIDKKLSSALTGYVPGLDETGLPAAGLFDKDGDGIADVLSFEDVNSQLFIKPIKRNDVYASISELAKTFKADETKTEKGYWTTENKYVDESQARATIKGMLDESAYATEAARRGLPLDYKFSDEEKQQFEDNLLLNLRNRVTESYSKTKDNADENADAALAETKRKNREAEKIQKEAEKGRNARARASNRAKYGGSGEPITADSFMYSSNVNRNSEAEKKVTPTDIPTKSKGYNISGNKMVVSPSEGIDEVVETIWVSPDKANVWVQGFRYETQGKDKAPKKTPFLYNTKKEANKAGKFIGEIENGNGDSYNTWSEFIQDLDKETGTGFDWSNQ